MLNGFPTDLARSATDASDYPFGIWFADPTTLYVADEGSGDNTFSTTTNTYTAAGASTTAGLQKWVFDGTAWRLAYTIQNGLSLGTPYSVAKDAEDHSYPTGDNTYVDSKGQVHTGPWTPATDGLRNLTGRVNANGTVTLWATTSTVSWSGDQGADPNAVVSVTDDLSPRHRLPARASPPSWHRPTARSCEASRSRRGRSRDRERTPSVVLPTAIGGMPASGTLRRAQPFTPASSRRIGADGTAGAADAATRRE
jgi:hypothetical protein